MTITHDMEEKSSSYDNRFYELLDKINRVLPKEDWAKFDKEEKKLYINGAINANNPDFVALCKGYKFFIAKSLF